MLKSRTMQSLLGLFVVAAVVFALMNMWWVPAMGRFSCSYEPAFLAAPQGVAASTPDSCPESLRGAMTDEQWAADRVADIEDEHDTTGWFYDEDGIRHEFDSRGEAGEDAQHAREVLRSVGAPSAPNGSYPAATHVEVKVAAYMRTSEVKVGVLVINHVGGPCEGVLSCDQVLATVLPSGAHLRIWAPNRAGGMTSFDYHGK